MINLPPIQLPTPPQDTQLQQYMPTTSPQNPPTDIDVFHAVSYKKSADVYHDMGKMSLNEFVEAHVYEFNILQAKSRATTGPPSSHPEINLELDHTFSLINQRLDTLTARLVEVSRLSTASWNLKRYNGIIVPFKEVIFADGTYPTAFPHNLPRLSSVNDLNDLTAAQRKSYYQGHHPGEAVPDNALEQLFAIGRTIGCSTLNELRGME